MYTDNSDTKINPKQFPQEIILIGSSGGIGQHLVKAFSSKCRILGTYNSGSTVDFLDGAEYYKVDVRKLEEVKNFFNIIGPSLSMPVMLYTAGISPNNITPNIIDQEWQDTIAVNLTGAMYCSREIIPWMRKLAYGRLIFISSVLSRIAVPGTLAYSVTKAGLNAMAKVIAIENAAKGITSTRSL